MESGSLLSAAEKLGYTQAGLTHMVKALENELGLVLLQRGKFGVRLTREGSRLMPLFRELVSVQEKNSQRSHLIQEQKASIIRLASVASVIKNLSSRYSYGFSEGEPCDFL